MTDIQEEPFPHSEEEYWENIDVNDCSYLLRALEREAYTAVVNALRAKGPPSEHTLLLLDHLKSALSINNELGRAEIRRAAFDPKLSRVSKVLNPNYDTCTEWSGCSMESRGLVEAGPSRAKPFANTTTTSIADQLLRQATINNEKINRRTGRAVELLALPHRPFVPERLRMLLRETDRPEQRIAPPLEPPLPQPLLIPVPPPSDDRSAKSEVKPPPKKRRKRMTKAAKAKEKEIPPELRLEKSPKLEEIPSVHPSILESTSSSSATAAAPFTPLAATAVPSSSAIIGGCNTSLGQPPQSGDAMKTWVSKIHEQEMAASAKKNGSVISPEDVNVPSTSYLSTDDPTKKKRRSKAPAQDSFFLNSCARTRPFIFERVPNGCIKPPRGNPDKRSSSKLTPPGMYTPTVAATAASNVSSISTPVARPNATETHLGFVGRNGLMDESPAAAAATSTATTPVYIRPTVPSTPTNSQVKRGQGSGQSARLSQGRSYYPNNCGVSMVGLSGSSSTMRSLSSSRGIDGRSGSLGSQQLTALQGISSGVHFKAASSNSNTSINSNSGGSTGSGIGGSSSGTSLTEPAQPVSARPPEDSGHDYGIPHPSHPSHPSHTSHSTTPYAIAGSTQSVPSHGYDPRMRDPGIRLTTGWNVPRGRLNDSIYRPTAHSSPHHSNPSNGLTPSVVPLHPTTPAPPSSLLQRTGSISSIRPRSGSRGAAAAAGVASTNRSDPVTDGMVQATVNNIFLEAAQKECANGKRMGMPRELLEKRENGVLLNRPSPALPPLPPPPSMQPTHPSTKPLSVFRPSVSGHSTEETNAAAMLSMMSGLVPQSQSPSHPPIHKTPLLAALTTPSSLPSQSSQIPHNSQPSTSSLDSSSFIRPSTVGMGGMGSSSLFGATTTSSTSSTPSLSTASLTALFQSVSQSIFPFIPSMKEFEAAIAAVNRETDSGGLVNDSILAFLQSTSNPQPTRTVQQQQPQPSPPAASAAAAATPVVDVPPRPSQRQYVLQPEAMSYAEFNPNDPLSYKSFSADGTPVQYGVSAEELYDQGILARPSTSGMNGGTGGSGVTDLMRRAQQPSPLSFGIVLQSQQAAVTAASQIGIPSSSMLMPSTSSARMNDSNGEPSTSREVQSQPDQFPPAAAAANVPREGGGGATEVKDILEQSCMELR